LARPDPFERRKVYSVSELNRDIKLHLESEFFDVWLAGEISNFKQPSSGHLYFTLKDDRAQIPAVMFRSARRFLKFHPADGMAVVARGRITVYEPRGAYQIQVEWMEPRGKGALQLAFEQLKEKLQKEGLFDAERKKALALLPQKIAIVTSPTGAAVRDICRILHSRFPNLEVVLYPAQVQGDLAAGEIAQGIRVLNRLGGFDAMIVGRGGGSLEDLWPFNEETVARAIAGSKIPVISAVGHEQDFTIADFVADVRAPTPSAAAEMVVARKEHFREHLDRLRLRAEQALQNRMSRMRNEVERMAGHQAFLAVRHFLQMAAQGLDEARYKADALIAKRLDGKRSRLESLVGRLEAFRLERQVQASMDKLRHLFSRMNASQKAHLALAHQKLTVCGARLQALSPLAVLGRGYSLAWDSEGNLLRDVSQTSAGDKVRLSLHRGELDCRVEKIHPPKQDERIS
jgi:exodeoxyribonuclease VII large subunit